MKTHTLLTPCAALLALVAGPVSAQTSAVPNFISYQGRVVDAAGANVGASTPVNRTVIFRIWDSPSSTNTANLIYSEAQTVTVSEGEFSVLVGQGVANPTATFGYSEADRKLADLSTAFNGSARYLGVTVAATATIALTDNEITPRQQIVSTAFAMRAKFAEGIGSSADLVLTPLTGTASNYGLGWYGTGRLFGTTAVDGPVLYGNAGGALGSNASGTRNIALRWDASGRVGIGATSISSATNKLTLQGDMATTPADQLTIRGNADNNKRLLLGYDTTANKASLQSYTALSTAGQLLLNPSGGNVGVNTSTPTVALDVTGAINASGTVTGGSFVSNGGNVGIGTTAPAVRLDIIDGATTGSFGSVQISRPNTGHTGSHLAFVRAGSQVTGLGYGQSSSTFGFGGGTSGAFSPNLLAIDVNGRVGIGTATPANLLQVLAPIAAQTTTNTVTSANAVAAIGASDTALHFGTYNNTNGWGNWIQSKRTWDAVSFPMAINPNGGNVGIGISSPLHTLDVAGTARVSGQVSLDSNIVMGNGPAIMGKNSAGVPELAFWPRAANGTFINYGTAGFFIRNNASTNTMTMTNDGVVTIGTVTSSPARLNVGSKTATWDSFGRLTTNGASSDNSTYTGLNLSIFAEGHVLASQFDVASDLRIKKVLQVSNGAADLETLLGIQVTDYRLRDSVNGGSASHKKVIAQQVESVYPQAVTKGNGEIPDIYQNASVRDGWVEIDTDLKTGELVKLIYPKGESVVAVLEVKQGAFRPDLKLEGDKVFVYGRQVEDFRRVDYDAISMLNVSATQQLKREKDAEIQELASQLKTLQDENTALRRELAAKDESLEARLVALERRISKEGETETVSLKTSKTAE
ncbi:MAG: hypothetical protein RLZZ179_1956 [Verrucomicrobiota bacterium]|jgi:hypothetical protein